MNPRFNRQKFSRDSGSQLTNVLVIKRQTAGSLEIPIPNPLEYVRWNRISF
jgi:hypothetical protein